MSLEQSNPLVTVYIPTFNRVELLKRAVQSVRQQTYQNLEIIIVDDCSNDGTHGYLEEVTKQDSRIRYFIKEKNSGACISRNIAIENAKGEYITGLDDDDYYLNYRIEEFVNSSSLIQGNCKGLCSLYTLHTFSGLKSTTKFLKKKIIKRDDLFINNIIGNQIFTTTKLLKDKCGFDERLSCLQDLECWINLLDEGSVYRLHNFSYVVDTCHENLRITSQNIEKYLKNIEIISKKHSLVEKQKRYLLNQMVNKVNGLSLSDSVKTFYEYPSITYLKRLSIIFLKYLISR